MPEKPLTKLRRQRRRVIAQLRKLEPLVAGYQDKLARIDTKIQELDPRLPIPMRHYQPNPVFARGELPRLAVNIMREADRPLGTLEIAMRALALKGVDRPHQWLRKLIRKRVVQTLGQMAKRGMVVRVGRGKSTRTGLAQR